MYYHELLSKQYKTVYRQPIAIVYQIILIIQDKLFNSDIRSDSLGFVLGTLFNLEISIYITLIIVQLKFLIPSAIWWYYEL
jgi:hypothetical protein